MASSVTAKEMDDKTDLLNVTRRLGNVGLESTASCDLVDTSAALCGVLDALDGLPTRPPSIYIDLEGENLSRQGTISILQLYVLPTKLTYLIDIHTLGNEAFTCRGPSGGTLKDILESPDIPKVILDVRNDSDALYHHYKINLAAIQDLQLMELATRTFPGRLVNELAKCIGQDGHLNAMESRAWQECKDKGVQLFDPKLGGSYTVFNERPLSQEIVHYCIQDVDFLPRLWARYDGRLTPTWRQRVKTASQDRVSQSQSATYVGHGRHKTLAPAGWIRL